MAPSRKKGARKAAAAANRRQWNIGDLVLAKVKGFPAWPAMVSEPKKWNYSADRKKVFVYFFGTEQIGFCYPADVEEFTEEKKEFLLVRRHGKGADFVAAVNEIIDCHEKLKKQTQVLSTDEANEINENYLAESLTHSASKEEAPAVAIKSHLKMQPVFRATHDLNFLTDAAVAAAAEDDLHNEERRLEGSDSNHKATKKPILTTYSTRSKTEVSRPEKGLPHRRTSARSSRSSSRMGLLGLQDMAFPSNNNTRSSMRVGTNTMRDRSLRRSKRIMKSPDDSNRHDMDSPAFVSNDNNDENDSETVTVDSDNLSIDGSSTLDSPCKPMQPESVVDNVEGESELSDRLDFQTNTVIIKKKRKPNRKRHSNDTADLVAKLDNVVSEADVRKTEHVLPRDGGKSTEICMKEDGDEHLPLVKRARVRMGRPSSAGEEQGSLVRTEEKLLDVSERFILQSSGVFNCKEDGSADNKSVFVGESNNLSLPNTSLYRKPQHWESRKNIVDGEAALPPSKRLHRALEAMSANVAEDIGNCLELSMQNRVEIQPRAGTVVIHRDDVSQDGTSEFCIESNPEMLENNAKSIVVAADCSKTSCIVDGSKTKSCNIFESKEGADSRRLKDSSLYDQTAEPNNVESNLISDSPNVGDEQPHLDCSNCSSSLMMRSADHCETELSELANPCMGSHADVIRMSSDPILVEELGSPQKDTNIYIDKAYDKGDKTYKLRCLLSAETNQDSQPPELVKEKESISKGPSATPMKIMNGCPNQHPSHSYSSSDDHLEDKTVSFTCTPSFPTDGLDSVGRASPPSSSICYKSTSDKTNCLESNSSCSPDVLALCDKAKLTGKSSSQGEASNALSSFETNLGSLTRTKESIGRATHIAIDCAKFGFANKVVEILARNLENESSLSRKVDLFFLVDSITQCSRGMKGDGGIYPSAIQPLLPRLLLAAAPGSSSSHENHRQCLKVLKVWHERKILPEPIIRHHIQELDAICSSYSIGTASRRPLRNERAFDDPIRQMEGMPVDEYGSNSSFQLPGFCMPAMLRDEDGGSDSDGENFEAVTPEHNAEKVSGERTPIPAVEKRRHILEDVDGELEMEDVAPSCEAQINTISNNTIADGGRMSNHQSGKRFGAPFAPPPKDRALSPPLPRSPHRPALFSAMPDSVSRASDWKLYPGLQNIKGNVQESVAKKSVMPNVNQAISDAVHHRAHNSKNFVARMPRQIPDFTNSRSFNGHSASHPSARASDTQPADAALNNGFHLRPPHPSPSNQFSYVHDQRVQSRRDIPPPSYHNRYHAKNAGNGNFYRDHDRMKFAPRDNIGECWRPSLPPISDACYPDGASMPRATMSYADPPCEPPRRNRWSCPPQTMNHRQFIPHRPPFEGPIPVANRGPNFWRPRRAI